MKIKLVVTGDMEKAALAQSLALFFSDALEASGVVFARPRKVHPTTSTRLPPVDEGPVPRTVAALVAAMAAEVEEGSDGTPADMVIGVDDLELANLDQPEVVVGWILKAIEDEIGRRYSSKGPAGRFRNRLRKKCSFHLLRPMTEAYFFAEPAALHRAGVSMDVPTHRVGQDVEDFTTDDPGFLPLAEPENALHASRGRPWWRTEKHPKRYLEFLCQQSRSHYDETVGGVAALRVLDWTAAAAGPETVAFARALFEDLAAFLDIDSPLSAGIPSPVTYPPITVRVDRLTLRNL